MRGRWGWEQESRLNRDDGRVPRIDVLRQDQRTIMTLISIRNLGVSLGAPLFSQLNLVVNAGDRIGLVAANGRGKTTLLRCVAGVV